MNLLQFEQDLKSRLTFSSSYPRESRSCTDLPCLVIFLVITLFFFCFGGAIIHQGIQSYHHDPYLLESKYHAIRYKIPLFIEIVCGMTAVGIFLTFIYFAIARKYPKCILFTSIIFTTLILMILTIVAFSSKHYVIGTMGLLKLIVYVLSLFYSFRTDLKSTLTLLELGTMFLKSSTKIFSIPVTISTFGLIFSFFLIGFYTALVQLHAANKYSSLTVSALMGMMGVIYLAVVLVFYYMMVFLISASALFWYFSTEITENCVGIKWLTKYHFGSVVYVALIQPVVKVLSIIVMLSEKENWLGKIAKKVVEKCFDSFKIIAHTMNSSSISLIPMTGQHLIKSAQDAALLYHDNPSLHKTLKKLKFFMLTSGIFLAISFPTLIGIVIANHFRLSGITNVLGIAIVLSISLVSVVYVVTLVEGISAVFIYFCFDRKLMEYGVNISHVEQSVKDVYEELYLEHQGKGKDREEGGRETREVLDGVKVNF